MWRQRQPTPTFTQVVIKGGAVFQPLDAHSWPLRGRGSPPIKAPLAAMRAHCPLQFHPHFLRPLHLAPPAEHLLSFQNWWIEGRETPQNTNMVSRGSDVGNSRSRNSRQIRRLSLSLTHLWETTHRTIDKLAATVWESFVSVCGWFWLNLWKVRREITISPMLRNCWCLWVGDTGPWHPVA